MSFGLQIIVDGASSSNKKPIFGKHSWIVLSLDIFKIDWNEMIRKTKYSKYQKEFSKFMH